MATKSTIWIKNNDSSYLGIYCSWNGSLSDNGKTLFEYYTNKNKVNELIALGHAYSVDEYCTQPIAHTFNNPVPGFSVFYSR